MYLSERQQQLVDGRQPEAEDGRWATAERSVRIGLVGGFLFVLMIEGLLLIRVFLH